MNGGAEDEDLLNGYDNISYAIFADCVFVNNSDDDDEMLGYNGGEFSGGEPFRQTTGPRSPIQGIILLPIRR